MSDDLIPPVPPAERVFKVPPPQGTYGPEGKNPAGDAIKNQNSPAGKGPKGSLERNFLPEISITILDKEITLTVVKENGLTNQVVTLLGWSRDGFINRTPYRTRVYDQNDLKDTINQIMDDGNRVYLENDYINSSEDASRVSYTRDVARSLSKLKMVLRYRNLNGQVTEAYLLYPERSLVYAKQDQSFYQDMNVSGPAMMSLGSILFSYYDNDNFERMHSIETYQEIASLYDSLILAQPNSYMLSETDGYLNMFITNAQYDYYTDLVPLLPIVLKGSISYYTPFMNFNALAEDRLLTMVDFPSNQIS